MTEQRLRYTGSWPPPDVLAEYPNWVFALDEEDVQGQDETTIKPERQQHYISEETAFTAADVLFSDGQERVGIVRLENGVPSALDLFEEDDWWTLQQQRGKRWELLRILSDESQVRSMVSLDKDRIFPLTVKSRLLRSDGTPLHFSLGKNRKLEFNEQ